jgi:hypothetical protein
MIRHAATPATGRPGRNAPAHALDVGPGRKILRLTARGRRRAGRAPARVEKPKRPPDHGFDESHGYGPSHGGPSGPGDVPADPAPDAGGSPRPEDEDDEA